MDFDLIIVMGSIFVGLPWIVLHYITKWKSMPRLTEGDEAMLEELYQLARRLDERMDTVERLAAVEHEDFRQPRLIADKEVDNAKLDELDRMMQERKAR